MKAIRILVILLTMCTVHFGASAHKYYFGFAEVEYNDITQKFEATVSLTSHDLEAAMEEQGVEIGTFDNLSASEKSALLDYINKSFQIQCAHQTSEFTLVGLENQLNGVLNIYLESSEVVISQHIQVRFDSLMEHFEEQQNKITLHYHNSSYTVAFLQSEKTKVIKLENKQE